MPIDFENESLITLGEACRAFVNGGEQHRQLCRIECQMRRLIGDTRHFERAFFKTLISNHKSISIPPHCLDAVSPLVDEQKQMTVEHAQFKHRRDDAGQPIKALAEIYRHRTEIDRSVSRTGQHASSSIAEGRPAAAMRTSLRV